MSETHWRGDRFRVYTFEHGQPVGLAEATDAAGVGQAIVTLGAESNHDRILTLGVLDWHEHRWLSSPGWVTREMTPFPPGKEWR